MSALHGRRSKELGMVMGGGNQTDFTAKLREGTNHYRQNETNLNEVSANDKPPVFDDQSPVDLVSSSLNSIKVNIYVEDVDAEDVKNNKQYSPVPVESSMIESMGEFADYFDNNHAELNHLLSS